MARFPLALVLMSCATAAVADDAARDRKAKVALALAGAKPAAVAQAPAPRPAPKSYPDGHAAATIDQMPLVVFIGCDSIPVPGAIVAKADSLGDVTGPAVIVGYPVGGRLYIDATLPGDPDPAKVGAAVKSAAKKIDLPTSKDMPAPKPLKWNL